MEQWWDELSDQERINYAVRSILGDGDTDEEREVLNAIEKPWHYKQEAFDYFRDEVAPEE